MFPTKLRYASLQQSDCDGDREVALTALVCDKARWCRTSLSVKEVFIAAGLLLNLVLAAVLYSVRAEITTYETSFSGIHMQPKVAAELQWWSMYSARNENETVTADAAWDAMPPAHGFIAVKPIWAEERDLMPSMELASDQSKRLYILEAYHMLHCLSVIRKMFYQLARGEQPSMALEHTSHCFDALRQNIMCHADDTPLYTFGRAVAGDGQTRLCRDWNYLRDWATEHTACYLDHKEQESGRFFECDGGIDGLVVGNP